MNAQILQFERQPPEPPATSLEAPPFRTAAQAIRFAVTRDGAPPRPGIARMIDTVSGLREYRGFEAAAQAGFVLSVLHSLGRLQEAVLIAQVAPPYTSCHCRRPCCSGKRMNTLWRQAIDTISHEALSALPPGAKRSYALRSRLVLKLYDGRLSLRAIAQELNMDGETLSRHHRHLVRWLHGQRASQHGEAIEGVENIAWREAESALRDAGIVGE